MNGEPVAGFEDIATGTRAISHTRGAAQIPAASTPHDRSLLGVVVAVVSIAGLYFGRDVLIPITLAIILAFVLSPVVNLLQRLRLWRTPAVILAVLTALGILALIGTLIGSQAASLTVNAPRYAKTIEAKLSGIQGFAVAKMAAFSKEFARRDRPVPAEPAPVVPGVAPGAAPTPAPTATAQSAMPVRVVNEEATPWSVARTILAPILGPIETIVIVLIVTIFVLVQKEDLRDRFIRVFGSNDLHRTTLALDDAGKRLSRYFLSQLGVNASFGAVIGLGLWLIGVPSAAMWGVLAGMLRFVPYIGSLLAAVAPMALGAAIDPGWSTTIYVAALFLIVEPLTGYVVEPLLYGHSTGLSPVSVIVAAIFWTWVWGPIGLILSTPLTLCLVVMGRHVRSLEFFDVLLGDRPALTTVESFYQRILAGDPDEALAQAEAVLEDHSLVDYYDDVVLQGLRLAAEDMTRGTVSQDRADRIVASMRTVVDELGGDAEDSGESTSVLIVAGTGAFDGVIATMAAQLVRQHGLVSRTVLAAAVARDTIDRLDTTGISTIILCHLSLSGTPAQLRYLVRRLRARAPSARTIIGLWPDDEAAQRTADVQNIVGASDYVVSLGDIMKRLPHAVAHRGASALA